MTGPRREPPNGQPIGEQGIVNSIELGNRLVSRRDILRGIGAVGLAAVASRATFASDTAQSSVAAFKPVRFAVIGDWGNGEGGQMAIAERMALMHRETPFELILSVGDNIYPNGDYEDLGHKFERPYEELLKKQVPFYTVF